MKLTNLLLIAACFACAGCTAIEAFSKRSDITLIAKAENPITEPKREMNVTLDLHGSNRDVLAAYKNAVEFTLTELGFKK